MTVRKMSDLERQKNLVRIANPNPRGKQRVVGVLQGLPTAPLNVLTGKFAKIGEDLNRRGHDIDENRSYGSVRRGELKKQGAGASLKEVNDFAKQVRAERDKLKAQVRNLDPVETDYNKLGMIKFLQDERRIQQFAAMPVAERAARIHQLRTEPGMCLNFAEAVLRQPHDMEVPGIDWSLRDEIRVALIRLLNQDAYENLSLQMDQLEVTENALRAVVEIVQEVSGTIQDLIEHAPDAFSMTMGAEKGEAGVYWTQSVTQSNTMNLGVQPVAAADVPAQV